MTAWGCHLEDSSSKLSIFYEYVSFIRPRDAPAIASLFTRNVPRQNLIYYAEFTTICADYDYNPQYLPMFLRHFLHFVVTYSAFCWYILHFLEWRICKYSAFLKQNDVKPAEYAR